MEPLRLYWLGHPAVELNGRLVKFEVRKALAMLIYLSIEQHSVSREVLANLLWSEFSQQKAFANLRRNLSSLEHSITGTWIQATHESINLTNRSNIWIDALSFQESIQTAFDGNGFQNGKETLKLYRGPFLEGFNLLDCPKFDEWQFFQRESYQRGYAHLLQRLVQEQGNASHWEEAIDYARQWVALDPCHESAQQALIQLYARSGQQSAALRQYEAYRQLLKDEFGQDPSSEILQLYEDIRLRKSGDRIGIPYIEADAAKNGNSETGGELSSQSKHLLKTKLFIPGMRDKLILRTRLLEMLNLGLKCRLTLISAPAGYGKSTLLGSWVRQCAYPIAWLSIDANDNDPSSFVNYIAAALQSIIPDQIQEYEPLQTSIFSFSSTSVTNLLVSQLNQLCVLKEPVFLILDDYQFISNKEVHTLTAFLIDHAPEHLHIVISSRVDPPFPFSRLRASDQVLEIRAQDIRFTRDEIQDFYQEVMEIALSQDDLSILEDRTEGWAAGMQMAALAMRAFDTHSRTRRDQFLRSFQGNQRFVMDYLVEEVLDKLSAGIKGFLLQTSLLEKLNGPLCDAVTSLDISITKPPFRSSQEILEYLDRSNYFVVPLDADRNWYRYHHLFRDLLKARMEKTMPEMTLTLHRLAADWYEQNGLVEDSIYHARALHDDERTAGLMENCIERMLIDGRISTVLQWCAELPDEVMSHHPSVCIGYIMSSLVLHKMDWVDRVYERLGSYLQNHPENNQNDINNLKAHFHFISAYRAYLSGDLEKAISHGELVIEQLPTDSISRSGYFTLIGNVFMMAGNVNRAEEIWQEALRSVENHPRVYAQTLGLCTFTRGHHMILQGKLHQAYELYESTNCDLTKRGLENLPGARLHDLGKILILIEWNWLDEALKCAERTLENAIQLGIPDYIMLAYSRIASIHLKQRKIDLANDALQKAYEVILTAFVDQSKLATLHYEHVQLLLAQGNLEQAEHILNELGISDLDEVTLLLERDYAALAHILVVKARQSGGASSERAERFLLKMIASAEQGHWTCSLVETLTLLALIQHEQGRVELSLQTLNRALKIGEPENIIQRFVDGGEVVQALLLQLRFSPGDLPQAYIQNILAAF